MERSVLGISLRDRFRNKEIRMRTRVDDVATACGNGQVMSPGRIRIGGHLSGSLEVSRPRASKRSVGRPQKRWYDSGGGTKMIAKSLRQGIVARFERDLRSGIDEYRLKEVEEEYLPP